MHVWRRVEFLEPMAAEKHHLGKLSSAAEALRLGFGDEKCPQPYASRARLENLA